MAVNERIQILMNLRGAREVAAGLRTTGAAMFDLDSATQRYGKHIEDARKRTFLMNQALFTLRRYSYMATLALTAGVGVVAHWGYEYNTQIQNARVAFGLFLGSQQEVNAEISKLYNVAAVTPFLFTDITTAARRFLAFGINLKDTNALITNITDALSAYGITSGAALNRASLALSHMMSLGRVTGQIVYQLARDNIPIIQALEHQFGLTGDQLRHVGTLGISATDAIHALNAEISGGPMAGAGRKFGLGTVQGLLSTIRDYTAQIVGGFEQHQFATLQRIASRTVAFLTGAGARGFKRGGVAGFLGAIDPNIARAWNLLALTFTSIVRIIRTALIPAFTDVAHILGPVLGVYAWALVHAFAFLSHHTFILRLVFTLLAVALAIQIARWMTLIAVQTIYETRMLVTMSLVKIFTLLGLAQVRVIEAETTATKGAAAAQVVYGLRLRFVGQLLKALILLRWKEAASLFRTTAVYRLWQVASTGAIRGSKGQFVAMTRLEKLVRLMRVRILLLSASLRALVFSIPVIGWILLLITALVILYFKWRFFHNAVNDTFFFIRDHWKLLAAILTGPFGLAALAIYKYFDAIKRKVLAIYNWVLDKIHWISRQIHRYLGFLIGNSGTGTMATNNGFRPSLYQGDSTAVANHPGFKTPVINPLVPMTPIHVEVTSHNHLHLDKKEIASSVSKTRQDKLARK